MKTILLLGTALVLTGCGDDQEALDAAARGEKRVAEAESKLVKTQERHRTTVRELNERIRVLEETVATKQLELEESGREKLRMAVQKRLVEEEDREEVPITRPRRPVASPSEYAPPPREAPVAADPLAGIPFQVANTMRQGAQQDWPGDVNMQNFRLKSEAEAYRKMVDYDRQAYNGIPYREKQQIVSGARTEYPADYSMQVFKFEKQAQAYLTLEEWERKGMPGKTIMESRASIRAARERWGTDYGMVVYVAQAN